MARFSILSLADRWISMYQKPAYQRYVAQTIDTRVADNMLVRGRRLFARYVLAPVVGPLMELVIDVIDTDNGYVVDIDLKPIGIEGVRLSYYLDTHDSPPTEKVYVEMGEIVESSEGSTINAVLELIERTTITSMVVAEKVQES